MRGANPRIYWLFLYIFSNIIAACLMLSSGELIGDVAGNPLYSKSVLVWALFLVVSSYYIILVPLFDFLQKIKVKKINFPGSDDMIGERIGKFLLFFQLIYMSFNLVNGVNVAGSGPSGENIPFALFWVFFPIDSLVMLYYAFYRDNKMLPANIFIWIISNLIRGWSGMYLLVIFFEWCRAYRAGRIRLRWIVMVGSAVVLLYPILVNLKWIMRASSKVGFPEAADSAFSSLDGFDYFTLVGDGITHLISRFQTTSILVEVIHMRDLLQYEFSHGQFTPFWMEGLHGIAFDRLFYGEKSVPIGVAFTGYADFDSVFEVGTWNTNISFAGWFFIAPYLIPFYIIYTIFLAALSSFLVKKLDFGKQAEDMLWFAWLIYLLPPWHSAFVLFIYSLLLFIMLKFIFSWVGVGIGRNLRN